MRKSGESFKQTVNGLIRLGLHARREAKPAKKFVVRAQPLGLMPGLSYDNIEELLDVAEGPLRR